MSAASENKYMLATIFELAAKVIKEDPDREAFYKGATFDFVIDVLKNRGFFGKMAAIKTSHAAKLEEALSELVKQVGKLTVKSEDSALCLPHSGLVEAYLVAKEALHEV